MADRHLRHWAILLWAVGALLSAVALAEARPAALPVILAGFTPDVKPAPTPTPPPTPTPTPTPTPEVVPVSPEVPAAADTQRIALVIGNSGYASANALPNSVADARLMAATLTAQGFGVTLVTDADQTAMKRAIADFGKALRLGGTDTLGLFYYAGHAVQSEGRNFLLPVDTAISDPSELDLYGIDAQVIMSQLSAARVKASIVILDACRNNPFADIPGFTDQGLAEMKAPLGSFVAYSTAPGSVALDGQGANSPYTAALASAISNDAEPIEAMFKKVRVKVLETTAGAQTPWESSSLTTEVVLRQGDAPAPVEAPDATPDTAPDTTAEVTPDTTAPAAVTFTTPVAQGDPWVVGQTLEELIRSEPHFPPFEGIPDELWKGQHCTNCHQWTEDRICAQSKFYTTAEAAASLLKEHPLGLGFKQTLKTWGAAGCP